MESHFFMKDLEMNEKVKDFLEKCRTIKNKERDNKLIELGLYEKEYAPLIRTAYSHITESGNKKQLKFKLNSESANVGDTVKVPYSGKNIDVVIEKIEIDQQWTHSEYPCVENDKKLNVPLRYKKVPVKVTDEEYEEILANMGAKPMTVALTDEEREKLVNGIKSQTNNKYIPDDENNIAKLLMIIAVTTYIGGFILGLIFGYDEYDDFDVFMALIYWSSAFISGTMFLGFAEIITLLTAIKNK